jgi:hypothetical protein
MSTPESELDSRATCEHVRRWHVTDVAASVCAASTATGSMRGTDRCTDAFLVVLDPVNDAQISLLCTYVASYHL